MRNYLYLLLLLSIGCDFRPRTDQCIVYFQDQTTRMFTLLAVRPGAIVVDSTGRPYGGNDSFATAFSIPLKEIKKIEFDRTVSGNQFLLYGATGCLAGFGAGCTSQAEEEKTIISGEALKAGAVVGALGFAAGAAVWGFDNATHRIESYDPAMYGQYLDLLKHARYESEPPALQLVP